VKAAAAFVVNQVDQDVALERVNNFHVFHHVQDCLVRIFVHCCITKGLEFIRVDILKPCDCARRE